MERKKVSIPELQRMKEEGRKITMLTAYDYPLALFMDRAGVDTILVGDSVAMVVLGYENTLPVTMDEMIHHCKAVRRAVKYAYLIGDMPFMSYQVSCEEAVKNAGRFIKEGGCEAIKLEGGTAVLDKAQAIIKAGIPVQGHIGLTPQSAAMLGEFKVKGKEIHAAHKIIDDAVALEKAGCFSLILECVPDKVAEVVTKRVKIPTIGIGAGPNCDGQVLVTHDMLGLFERFVPKFAKQYLNLSKDIVRAFENYIKEVREERFPTQAHSFVMKDDMAAKLRRIHL